MTEIYVKEIIANDAVVVYAAVAAVWFRSQMGK